MRALFALISFLSLSSWAHELRPGDVILQPMRCQLCRMIEQHEGSIYSHMGLVVEVAQETWIIEALGDVHLVRLTEFLAKGDNTRPHLILRPREAGPFPLKEVVLPLIGAEYDHDFLWDNLGRDGREAYYCSEIVAKLLNPFLLNDLPTKKMDYSLNRAYWERHFRGKIPEGLPGNSPGDFEKFNQFIRLGTYQGGIWSWN